MLKLRTILLYDYGYYLLLILVLVTVLVRVNITKKEVYQNKRQEIEGIITKYSIDGDKLSLEVKAQEKLVGNYYFKSKEEKDKGVKITLGKKIKLIGMVKDAAKNTTKYLFNYQEYLKRQGIYKIIEIEEYDIENNKVHLYYKIKNKIKEHLGDNPYVKTFILGDKTGIDKEVMVSYQENGIAHLLAISGMHISLLASILLKLLKKMKIKEETSFTIVCLCLGSYLLIAQFSASILRGVLFFILFGINKKYYFYIKPLNIFLVALSITLFINPYFIFDVGCQYSFVISFYLIYLSEILKSKSYLGGLLKVSVISFIVSIPISLYNFYQVNLFSLVLNLFYVPLVSIIIYPLSLLVGVVPKLEGIFNILIYILEKSSLWFSKKDMFKLYFYRLPGVVYLLYGVVIFGGFWLFKKKKKKIVFGILGGILVIHYLLPYVNGARIEMIDVGQGDSILICNKKEAILIDTGGRKSYEKPFLKRKQQNSIVRNTTIPLLKSLGIKKLKYLIITHGDYDHIGEGINLINNFKVEKVVINSNQINFLEQQLIKKKKYIIGEEGLVITCGDIKLIQLNKDLKGENDSSLIFLGVYNKRKFLLMGDASKKSEEELLKNYTLGSIDILKVGHHGSDTSSSSKFIESIKPEVSLISVGKDNKYGHPSKEVLKILNKSKIYRTDVCGSVSIIFNKNNYSVGC